MGSIWVVVSAADEVTVLRAWLAQIGEKDAVNISDVLNQRDAAAREYFIGRASFWPVRIEKEGGYLKY